MYFLNVFFIDPCKKKLCEFYSKCIKGSDGKAECACPVCDNKEKYSPVCGDNGNTYASQCELERDSCIKKSHIKMAKKEACGKLLSVVKLIKMVPFVVAADLMSQSNSIKEIKVTKTFCIVIVRKDAQ